MAHSFHKLLFLCLLLLSFSCKQERTSNRSVIDFDQNWRFSLADSTLDASKPNFTDSTWRQLDLPHDWSIEGKFDKENPAGVGGGALPGGIGWYRKTFQLDKADSAKLVFIDFDGIYSNGEVWINGEYLGKRPNGYISYRYELTPHLHYGDQENVIAVKVNNDQQPNSRWYSGSGIYRNVWLVKTNKTFVEQYGTQVITPQVSSDSALVALNISIENRSSAQKVNIINNIVSEDGQTVASGTLEKDLKAGDNQLSTEISVKQPHLWSVDDPFMYKVVTTIEHEGKIIDEYSTPLGIRYFNFYAKKGFTLNGQPLKIRGVCNHHDLGALGAAVNVRAMERQLEIMKGMGVNGIRTAHNPPAPELLQLCDSMGFIVMDEAFDMWAKKKSEYDYASVWDEWHKQDLEDLIKRDRNHPSIFIWSIGNEILEQFDSTGTTIAKELADIVKSLDETRPITSALNDPQPKNNIYLSGALDLVGFNYHHQDYEPFPENFPGEKFIATETTSALATRGHYDMPSDSIRRWPIRWDLEFTEGNADNTVSAYDNVSAPWGSTHEETLKIIEKHDYLSGMYIWTGFDYIGEPTPYTWPSRSSYFGVVDLAGFPKDTYYLYKSEWTEDSVLHVFPHWNWEEGKTVDVWAYYNHADEAELFLNGESKGIKRKEGDGMHVMWRLSYEPGVVKVVTRKDNEVVMTKEVHTAGKAAKIKLEVDRADINADGKDLAFVTVTILDKDGNVVPDADNQVNFSLEGKGKIVGVDNGDPTSMESFKAEQRKAFHGLALAIIQSSSESGSIKLTASADGLEGSSLNITTK
ncbi:DUF4982 domain-containing protein [Fulvivirga maritima]|uniref:beta-galactosidase GalB n=1 Tax=Fulvivirga maritima TaxID=2904247 RepID=UPI001F26CDDE|nr:beta-galactosidase GalB [Fulvivirga maritima]UII24606.1 DUF4982 domain-containing protein [Fulvivirga maritima]